METFLIVVGIILWLASGFYGTLTLFRCAFDIKIQELGICCIGSIAGPVMLFIGYFEKYGAEKVFFKKFEK